MAAKRQPKIADQQEVLEMLTEKMRAGNVTAAKALLAYHGDADEPAQPSDDWSAIYGDSDKVTPLRRKSA